LAGRTAGATACDTGCCGVPTGIEVLLVEVDAAAGEGYQFSMLGDHDADVDTLIGQIRLLAEGEIGHTYLEGASHRTGWTLRDGEVAGRLVWDEEGDYGKPYNVVVDGRTLTWEELGLALESYEGWGFRLVIESSIVDARSDAEVIELRRQDPTE
jgi:hypothetical protein